MRIKIGKKVYLFGAKAKAKHRADRLRWAREIARLAKEAKKPSENPIDVSVEFSRFLEGLKTGASPFTTKMSARERIITVTSYLDEELRFCITLKMSSSRGSLPSKSTLTSIFEGTGALASFSDKISFCAAFGLLPNELKGDLNILKDIRNQYAAHTFLPVTFDDPLIVARCNDLQRKLGIADNEFENESERRFVESAWMIVMIMLLIILILIQEHKFISKNMDKALDAAKEQWNGIFKNSGWTIPPDPMPEPSPEKSA